MVHRREVAGRPVLFGNQGALYKGAMTWWDHETGSLWSQPLGQALAGPLRGTRLELHPSMLTDWGTWRRLHPETKVLDAPAAPTGFRLEDAVIVFEAGTEAAAYPLAAVDGGVLNDVVGGIPVAVFVSPGDLSDWRVFSRRLDDGEVDLRFEDGLLVDDAGGAAWDPGTGMPARGATERLDVLGAFTTFEPDFRRFFPRGRVVSGEGDRGDQAR